MTGIHHTAIVTADVERSMRFWRDGLGLTELFDHTFTGDWPTLFGAATDQLRSVFLGDPDTPDSGIVELVVFEDAQPAPPTPAPRSASFCCRCSATSRRRLRARRTRLRRGCPAHRDARTGGKTVAMAVITAPDGVRVELIGPPA